MVNHKRVYRLYREEGLAVRRRRRKRACAAQRLPTPMPSGRNQRWSMDFMADTLPDGPTTPGQPPKRRHRHTIR